MFTINCSDLSSIRSINPELLNKQPLDRICRLLSDSLSRELYFGNLFLAMGGDGDFAKLRSDYPAYFHKEVVTALTEKDGFVFINAGAAGNGEMNNIHRMRLADSLGKAYLFEPDKDEMHHLKGYSFPSTVKGKMHFESLALTNHNGNVSFSPGVVFEKSGKISDVGSVQIPCQRLDDYVQENNILSVDFLKTDVEGFEQQLLEGAKESIQHFRPVLAISIYHSLNDYFSLPLYIRDVLKYQRFYVGYHPNFEQLRNINEKRILAEIILYCLP